MTNSVLDSKKTKLFLTMIYYINTTLFHEEKQEQTKTSERVHYSWWHALWEWLEIKRFLTITLDFTSFQQKFPAKIQGMFS